jgi:hypothetical protein
MLKKKSAGTHKQLKCSTEAGKVFLNTTCNNLPVQYLYEKKPSFASLYRLCSYNRAAWGFNDCGIGIIPGIL